MDLPDIYYFYLQSAIWVNHLELHNISNVDIHIWFIFDNNLLLLMKGLLTQRIWGTAHSFCSVGFYAEEGRFNFGRFVRNNSVNFPEFCFWKPRRIRVLDHFETQKSENEISHQWNTEIGHKILWDSFQFTYLVMATIGIHRTETSMRNTANTIHQWGHSNGSVTPLSAFHAGYRLPSDASSMKEAINIVIMAIGDTYFQQTIQYMLGREPVISSMSSANLCFELYTDFNKNKLILSCSPVKYTSLFHTHN